MASSKAGKRAPYFCWAAATTASDCFQYSSSSGGSVWSRPWTWRHEAFHGGRGEFRDHAELSGAPDDGIVSGHALGQANRREIRIRHGDRRLFAAVWGLADGAVVMDFKNRPVLASQLLAAASEGFFARLECGPGVHALEDIRWGRPGGGLGHSLDWRW